MKVIEKIANTLTAKAVAAAQKSNAKAQSLLPKGSTPKPLDPPKIEASSVQEEIGPILELVKELIEFMKVQNEAIESLKNAIDTINSAIPAAFDAVLASTLANGPAGGKTYSGSTAAVGSMISKTKDKLDKLDTKFETFNEQL